VSFGTRKRRARACMDSEPEPHVLSTVGPVELERRGIRERAGVPVGGTGHDEDAPSGGHVDAADRRRDAGHAELTLERALDPHALLDEPRDELPVVAQLLFELGSLADEPERRTHHPCGGLLPGGEKVGRDPHDVVDGRE
jgi:hypothetical protein